MSGERKSVAFVDTALDDLRDFPEDARRQAGFEIDRVQQGEEPTDWRAMPDVGAGVNEIRIHEDGEHRVLYVAKFGEAVFVLHCFQKKTQKTAKRDIELAKKRYKAIAREQAK